MQAKTLSLKSTPELLGVKIYPAMSLKVCTPQREQTKIKGKAQEDVKSFCYVRGTLERLGGTTVEIEARIGKTQGLFATLNTLWTTKEVTLK